MAINKTYNHVFSEDIWAPFRLCYAPVQFIVLFFLLVFHQYQIFVLTDILDKLLLEIKLFFDNINSSNVTHSGKDL